MRKIITNFFYMCINGFFYKQPYLLTLLSKPGVMTSLSGVPEGSGPAGRKRFIGVISLQAGVLHSLCISPCMVVSSRIGDNLHLCYNKYNNENNRIYG